MSKCLYCYKELRPGEVDFHKSCCRKFFGTAAAPSLDYTRAQIDELAAQIIKSQTTLTGVQPKLSLNLDKHKDFRKLTIAGLWGDYIFKPQTERFAMLPENEDLTMHLAEIAKLKIVPHTLIRMKDADFKAAYRTCGVPEIVFDCVKKKYVGLLPKFEEKIRCSFLSDELKTAYVELLHKRLMV